MTELLTVGEAEAVKTTKALADKAIEAFGGSLTGRKRRSQKYRPRRKPQETTPPEYGGLAGRWEDYYRVAEVFERKALDQDRGDLRHNILLELATAQQRNGDKPLSAPTLFRIGSYVVADYWRNLNKTPVKVCILSGSAQKPDYGKCNYRQKPKTCATCGFRAFRPIESLNTEVEDGEGGMVALIDTIADDSAIDLEAWVDARTWLLGCPHRLLQIAHKRKDGIPLDNADKLYLGKWRKKAQKRLL